MPIYLTLNISSLTIPEFGGRTFVSPLINYDISLEFDEDEIRKSTTLQSAIDNNDIILRDSESKIINDLNDLQANVNSIKSYNIEYTPSILGDWDTMIPSILSDGLDQVASRIRIVEDTYLSTAAAISLYEPIIGYTPVNLAGDTMLGYLTLNGDPTSNLHATTKSYVDNLYTSGVVWLQHIETPNLYDDSLSSPPTPISDEVYIVSSSPTGAWSGLAGHAVYWNGSTWVSITGAPIQIGERFGLMLEDVNSPTGIFTGKKNQIAEVTGNTPGSFTYTFTLPAKGNTVTDKGLNSSHRGDNYWYDGSNWIEIYDAIQYNNGVGLDLNNNIFSLSTSGVSSGTYNNVSVDIYGRVTSGSNVSYLTGNQNITLTGDVTGNGSTSITTSISDSTITNKVLTGFVSDGDVAITSIDSILTAFNKTQGQLNNRQPLDSTLTALAAFNSNGIITQTAADTFTSRTITGTLNRIDVTNGDGVSGNPIVNISSTYTGQNTIITLGTITTGTWNGTPISNSYIANSSLTIGTTNILLGGTALTLAGLTSVTSTSFIGTLTGNSSTATALQTARTINGVSFNGTANITVTADAGTLTGTALNSSIVTSSLTSVGTIITGTWNASTISANKGGTGITTYNVGDIIYADTISTLAKLSDVSVGSALISGGVNTAPTWGKIGLTTHVSGILSVTNGGTGTSTQFTQNSIILAGTSGVYTEDTNFTYNPTTKQLALSGSDSTILLATITNEPTAPIVNNLLLYSKSIAGRVVPKWVGPAGVDNVFQNNLFLNNISLISPGSGTIISTLGCTVTNVGTVSHPTPTSTSLKTQTRRFLITMTKVAPAFAENRPNVLECWRGNASGLGGFFFSCRFSFDVIGTGNRFFTGLIDTVAALTNFDPTTSSANSKVGIAINTNTGNLNIIHNTSGSAPTVIDLGSNFPVNTTNLYELILYAAPNSSTIGYRVTNLSTGQQAENTLSSNLPASTVFLARRIWMTNNATNGTLAFSCNRIGLETDY